MWHFLKRLLPRPNVTLVILLKDQGVEVKTTVGERVAEFLWQDVIKVTAFKRDLFIVDLICFELALADGTFSELNEEMLGWDAFTKELQTQLSGSMSFDDWFQKVVSPAFAPSPTVVYERNAPHA